MSLFQFFEAQAAPDRSADGSSPHFGLINCGWIFCPFGRGLVVLPVMEAYRQG